MESKCDIQFLCHRVGRAMGGSVRDIEKEREQRDIDPKQCADCPNKPPMLDAK